MFSLAINQSINAGSNNLTLSTGADSIDFVGSRTLTAGTISLTQAAPFGTDTPAILTAPTVVLENTGTADQGFYRWMAVGDYNITLTSGGDITIADNSDFTKSTGSITLAAGGLLDFGASVSLSAPVIRLRQNGAFGANAPATLTASTALGLENTGTDPQAVQGWMVSGDPSFLLDLRRQYHSGH